MSDAWTLQAVPAAAWGQYTALRPSETTEMLTRSDFLAVPPDLPDGFETFCAFLDQGGTYPVALHCLDCGSIRYFEACPWDDAGDYDQCFQLGGLDKRMEPWLQEHRACRYQLALPL